MGTTGKWGKIEDFRPQNASKMGKLSALSDFGAILGLFWG